MTAACTRCGARAAWSARLCWDCHRAYAAAQRGDPHLASGLARGVVVGIAVVAGAISAGAPGFIAVLAVPIAMAFGGWASRRHRMAWIQRTGPSLPSARMLTSPRGPGTDTGR